MNTLSEDSRVRQTIALAGSYWSLTYQDGRGVYDLGQTLVWALDELAIRLSEALACVSVDTVPTFAVPRWMPLDRLPATTAASPYGAGDVPAYRSAGAVYGAGSSPALFAPVTGQLVECPLLCETAGGGGRTWVQHQDYRVVDGEAVFDSEPGVSRLWAFEPRLDSRYVVDSFGAVAGVREPASHEYNTFVKALHAQAAGDTAAGLRRLVCACFEVPSVGDRDETVVDVISIGDRSFVVTDRGSYQTGSDFLPAVGSVLPAGGAVDLSVTFDRYSVASVTPPAQLHLDAGLCLSGPLTFGPGDNVSGDPAIVARFRRESAERQQRYGLSLSQSVENRPLGQTDYLLRELLRYSAIVVRVRKPTGVGSVRLAACRPVMPVHAALILQLDARPLTSSPTTADAAVVPAPATGCQPAVDAGPLTGYSRSSVASFGC